MRIKIVGAFLLFLGGLQALPAAAQNQVNEVARPVEHGTINFLTPINADPVIQHSKEVYVLNGCAYCHGVNLRVRNGEAADLLRSSIVGGDTDGSSIVAILKNGIAQTAKLSPMPQFSDLSDADMHDIARWVHYSRMQERSAEILDMKELPAGDAAAGKAVYDKSCASCHTTQQMAAVAKSAKGHELAARILKPAILTEIISFKTADYDNAKHRAGRTAHSSFTENSNAKQVSDLAAYLATLK